MPEGPEIHRTAAQLNSALARRKLTDVEFGIQKLKAWEAKLRGRRVRRVQARGKALLTHFEGGITLYSRNQLYGVWMVTPSNRWPETGRSLRVRLENRTSRALLYSASDIAVIDTAAVTEHPYVARLGPDLLDPGTTVASMSRRFAAPEFAGRRLGALLLDQSAAAGMGNYLRSEALFMARLHPNSRPKDLRARALDRLAKTMLQLSRRSLRTGGITAPPRWAEPRRRRGLPFEAYRFMVFGRAGQHCLRCRTAIARVTVSARRLYLCPNCQPTP